MELWEGGRFSNVPLLRAASNTNTTIDVWLNWELVGSFKSYEMARSTVAKLLKTAPASLHDLAQYLEF